MIVHNGGCETFFIARTKQIPMDRYREIHMRMYQMCDILSSSYVCGNGVSKRLFLLFFCLLADTCSTAWHFTTRLYPSPQDGNQYQKAGEAPAIDLTNERARYVLDPVVRWYHGDNPIFREVANSYWKSALDCTADGSLFRIGSHMRELLQTKRSTGLIKAIELKGQKAAKATRYTQHCSLEVFHSLEIRGLRLHYDNSSSHIAALNVNISEANNIVVLERPSYSPDFKMSGLGILTMIPVGVPFEVLTPALLSMSLCLTLASDQGPAFDCEPGFD
ncbi:hypothetical protein EVAR_31987_1 [Eumeta japonica]|uniref:Uncharacterized protein n=1 Tax=Eumeta variegata TaxID=151549 RepID=A0A4C1VU37_EUMVA|nr:hypothetical protein EVAR_31987_1 [Eumeta japonica]